jgi:ribonuclease P protein component
VLKKREDFKTLFKNGKRFRHGPFILSYISSESANNTVHCGFVAPKRYLRKAVHRNRTKRLLREVYRKHREQLESLALETGIDLKLLLGYNGSEIPNFTECEEKISGLIVRLNSAINALRNED